MNPRNPKHFRTAMRRSTAVILLALLPVFPTLNGQTFNSDGAKHDPAKQSGWALPPVDKATVTYNNCLRCHQPGGPVGASDKSGYLLGGHKNMSRPADGLPWGIPGVDAAHKAVPALPCGPSRSSTPLSDWLDVPRLGPSRFGSPSAPPQKATEP